VTKVGRIKSEPMAGRAVGQAIGGKFRDTARLRYPVPGENKHVALLDAEEFPSRACSGLLGHLGPTFTIEPNHLKDGTYAVEGTIDSELSHTSSIHPRNNLHRRPEERPSGRQDDAHFKDDCCRIGEKFDAGVRIGEDLERDMVATRMGPDWRFSVVGSPPYFERRSPPATPYELSNHNCINMRLATAGGFLRWAFRSPEGRDLSLRVEGQATFNTALSVLGAAIDGIGLGFVPHELAAPYVADGRLAEVLAEWCPIIDGFHLYYPSRKRNSTAFAAFIEVMRHRDSTAG
jgi:LysR substrate binding domain